MESCRNPLVRVTLQMSVKGRGGPQSLCVSPISRVLLCKEHELWIQPDLGDLGKYLFASILHILIESNAVAAPGAQQ